MAIGKSLWRATVNLRITGVTRTDTGSSNLDHDKFFRVPDDVTDAEAIAICTAVFNFDYGEIRTNTGGWSGVTVCALTNLHKTTLTERNALRAAGYQVTEF